MFRLITVVCLLAILGGGTAWAKEGAIGVIKEVDGTAFITSNGQRTPATLGASVFLNDDVETGADGSVGITFIDESILSLGPETMLTVDEYVFDLAQNRGSFVSRLSRGTLLYVSGLIAKIAPGNSRVDTPVSTIGIRGTRFLIRYEGS